MSMNNHLYRSRDDRMLAGVAGGLAEMWDADPSLVRIVWALLVVLTGGIALVVYIVMAIVVPEDDGRSWAGQAIDWNRSQGPSGASPTDTTGAGSTAPGATPGAAFADSPPAGSAPPVSPIGGPPPGSWPQPPGSWPQPQTAYEARAARRAARWEDRAARREARGRDGRSGAMVVGALLILVGAWYLLREFLPTIDFDWFWPLVLVGVGVLVLFLAIRPRSDDTRPGGPVGDGGSGGA
jgi:phage shock protein PspC (stress-responsive transcriptional regulator)